MRHYYRFANDAIGLVGDRFDAYGDIYYVPNSGGGLYVSKHPDHIRDVLITHGSSYGKAHSAFARLARVLGQGLLTTDGATWKRHRRMIQPAFHKARLRGYSGMMVAEAERTAERWRDGESVDLGAALTELTLRVVSRSLFSHEVAGEVDAITGAVAVLQESFSRPALLPRWLPTPHRRRVRRSIRAIDDVMYRLIAARRAGSGETAAAGDLDLLQMLVDIRDEEGDGTGLTDTEIRDQLVTFYMAGHETTSHALTWTLYLLSQHPEAEACMFAELASVLEDRLPSFEDFDSLSYTQSVIEESMRLYPPVYVIARKATADTCIGDYPVPAGSEVALWIYMTHHDARWYPDPTTFDPERFADENAAKRPRYAYLPFGVGARTCIGKTFATIEAVLILATLAQRFRLSLTPGQIAGADLTPETCGLPRPQRREIGRSCGLRFCFQRCKGATSRRKCGCFVRHGPDLPHDAIHQPSRWPAGEQISQCSSIVSRGAQGSAV